MSQPVITPGEHKQIDQAVFKEAVRGHASGVWAGAAVGMGYGLISGGIVGLVPMLFTGSTIVAGAWIGLTAISGAIGAVTGMSAGGDNGSNAGAVSGGAKLLLHEIRSEFDDLKKDISSIKQKIGLDPKTTARDDVLPNAEQLAVDDAIGAKEAGWFSPASLAMGAAFGALIGVVLAGALSLQGMSPNTSIGGAVIEWMGKAGFSGNGIFAGIGLIGAAHGAFFGFNIPRIASKLQDWARKLMVNDRTQQPSPETEPARAPEVSKTVEPSLEVAPVREVSFQDYLAGRAAKAEQPQLSAR